jgi:hypothetical protein
VVAGNEHTVGVKWNGALVGVGNNNYSQINMHDWDLQPEITVPLDIKPTSCPNSINTKSKGVIPFAILGTEDFDASQIDPETITLEGISPLRWHLEDVGTPHDPLIGKETCDECSEEGPDGYMDLTFKFDNQELIAALGEVEFGDCLVLMLTANLKEEFGSSSIIGEDVVLILKNE